MELDKKRILEFIERVKTIDDHLAELLDRSVKLFVVGSLLDVLKKVELAKTRRQS